MVRYAVYEELERVNELRKQVNDVHVEGRPDIFRSGFNQELQDYLMTMWKDENTDVIVALRNEEICGFACVQYVHKPESPYSLARHFYHIEEFGVDAAHRRQKVASEMMEFIKLEARRKGYQKIELDMWEFNEPALRMYESAGFKTYRRYMELEI